MPAESEQRTCSAREFVEDFRGTRALIELIYYRGGKFQGRGWALVLSEVKGIAVMLQDCGDVKKTLIKTGAVVNFSTGRGRKPRIIGEPAYFVPVTIGHRTLGT